MNKIVIYPGRFQPMLSHHAEVFKQLQSQFPDAEVYIGTSDKVELPKSPFNFKEKQQIAAAHGIPADRVLAVTRTYHQEDYAKYFNPAETVIIFAVGEKDLDRFPFSNTDPNTGLDMTVRGEAKPKYFQKINTLKADPKPMSERGYITLAPTIKIGNEIASASAFRDALKAAPDAESAKQIYTKQFGTYNDKVFNLIYNKIARADMSEQINILRKLAGLPVNEAAPVEFSGADAKAAKFLPPGASSSKMSIANRFPKGADINDVAVKQEQFIQALLRSPESLMSEFSERLDPKDDNSLAVGQKLSDIMQLMNQKDIGIAGLPKDMKQFVLDLTVNAVKNMELNAGDNSPAYSDMDDEDEFEKESVDLNNIRDDYGIEESKPDFLDLDKDGNKKEPMKKAAKDKKMDEAEDDEDDDSWIPSEDEFDQEIKHGYKGRKVEAKDEEEVEEGYYSVRSNQLKQELENNGWERIPAKEVPDNAKYGYRKNGVGSFYKVIDEPYHSFDVSFVKPRRVNALIPLDDLLKLIKGSSVAEEVEEGLDKNQIAADQVLAKAGSGELDIYDVMTNPKNPAEATAAKIIQQMYDDVAIDHSLHPDDDFEKILDIVADQLAADYGDSDAETRESVAKNNAVQGTAGNALEAAMAELRKLAGLR